MPAPTQPAFVHYGTWDDRTRQHECMKWMEKYTHAFDAKAYQTDPASKWFSPTHKLHNTDGRVFSGADASWTALREELYAPFAEHCHDPFMLITWEVDDGWEMLGLADLWWKLAVPGKMESNTKGEQDRNGKSWDGAAKAAFHFHYVKDPKGVDGILLEKTAIFADKGAAVGEMLKRGMLKPGDLLK